MFLFGKKDTNRQTDIQEQKIGSERRRRKQNESINGTETKEKEMKERRIKKNWSSRGKKRI